MLTTFFDSRGIVHREVKKSILLPYGFERLGKWALVTSPENVTSWIFQLPVTQEFL